VVESPSNFQRDSFDKKIMLRTKLRKTISGGTFLRMKSPSPVENQAPSDRKRSLKYIKDILKKGESEVIETMEL